MTEAYLLSNHRFIRFQSLLESSSLPSSIEKWFAPPFKPIMKKVPLILVGDLRVQTGCVEFDGVKEPVLIKLAAKLVIVICVNLTELPYGAEAEAEQARSTFLLDAGLGLRSVCECV